jgi:hypothetical protein
MMNGPVCSLVSCELTSASEMHHHTIILHFEMQGKIVKSKIELLNPNHKVRHVTEPLLSQGSSSLSTGILT